MAHLHSAFSSVRDQLLKEMNDSDTDADGIERRILEMAITGMLPHTRIGRAMASKLKVYVGPDHPHQAQQPEPLK